MSRQEGLEQHSWEIHPEPADILSTMIQTWRKQHMVTTANIQAVSTLRPLQNQTLYAVALNLLDPDTNPPDGSTWTF